MVYCGSAVESLANKELNKNKAVQAYSLALSDPAYQADDNARLQLFRRVLEALDIPGAEQLLPQTAAVEAASAPGEAPTEAVFPAAEREPEAAAVTAAEQPVAAGRGKLDQAAAMALLLAAIGSGKKSGKSVMNTED